MSVCLLNINVDSYDDKTSIAWSGRTEKVMSFYSRTSRHVVKARSNLLEDTNDPFVEIDDYHFKFQK